ncbi:hypothetical protein B0H14DRAFT_3851873 [Mycena olivaceomarginata]|nr:hypothetical protein B0H14DRAFT_3851873 [Mycena olivaceomarginata]
MAADLRAWIKDHLMEVAETYGANLSGVPLEAKGKKAQISEFLTVGAENDDSVVWAMIHDRSLVIPVKFSKEAVMACNTNSVSGRRLTETRFAFVTMKKFRPMSTRIPVRNGGMTADQTLALYCESVSIISESTAQWGSPKILDTDPNLQEWSHGLRQDGGAGNILRDRKKAKEGDKIDPPAPTKRVVSPRKPLPIVEPKPQASTSKSTSPMHKWNKRWNDTLQDPLAFVRPSTPPPSTPPPAVQDARDLGSSSPSEKYSVSSSPISGWSSPSPSPSRWREDEDSKPPTPTGSSPRGASSPCPPQESSYLRAPTPAQRRQRSPMPLPARKVARPPPPPPPRSGPARILVPDSDTSQSQPSQPSQQAIAPPSQPVVVLSQPVMSQDSQSFRVSPQRAPIEDVEMLSEDDKQTDERLFRRRGSDLARGEPAKKRRIVSEAGKLNRFTIQLDYVKLEPWIVGWDRLSAAVKGRVALG